MTSHNDHSDLISLILESCLDGGRVTFNTDVYGATWIEISRGRLLKRVMRVELSRADFETVRRRLRRQGVSGDDDGADSEPSWLDRIRNRVARISDVWSGEDRAYDYRHAQYTAPPMEPYAPGEIRQRQAAARDEVVDRRDPGVGGPRAGGPAFRGAADPDGALPERLHPSVAVDRPYDQSAPNHKSTDAQNTGPGPIVPAQIDGANLVVAVPIEAAIDDVRRRLGRQREAATQPTVETFTPPINDAATDAEQAVAISDFAPSVVQEAPAVREIGTQEIVTQEIDRETEQIRQLTVLDSELLQRYQDSHSALLERLIESFIAAMPGALAEANRTIAAGKVGPTCEVLENMALMSANIGAIRLAAMCESLRRRIKLCDLCDQLRDRDRMRALVREINAVRELLGEVRVDLQHQRHNQRLASAGEA